jgi:hypothetical protein
MSKIRQFKDVASASREENKKILLEGLESLRGKIESGEIDAFFACGKDAEDATYYWTCGRMTYLQAMGMASGMREYIHYEKNNV